jgi:hypothetical protein
VRLPKFPLKLLESRIHTSFPMTQKILYLNRNLGFDDSTTAEFKEISRNSSDLMIPLHFFFSRKFASDEYSSNAPNRPYFPLCGIHRQKIIFELEFHKQTFFTESTKVLELGEFRLITEEITVNPEERKYFCE